MSGGVDSSVSALLMKESGHEVIGVTLRFHTEECSIEGTHNVCCSPQDVRDATEVSRHLGIPHLTFDWEKLFRERVINYFVEEYARGRTPNPCAVCNREVKTGFFARYLRDVAGIDRLVTGHYAIIEDDPFFGRVIKRALDRKRDQSYFLALVRREDLNLLEFPLGTMRKEEVRKIAEEKGIRVAKKRDSQEVCFLMGMDPGKFVESEIGPREGDIVDLEGRVLGKHRGTYNFTIGQRRGLGISAGKPLYVIDIDAPGRRIIVGEEKELYRDSFIIGEINQHVDLGLWDSVEVQIRYRTRAVEVKDIVREGRGYKIKLKEEVRGVAPGQIAAFYSGERLLGGAVIEDRG